MTPPLPPLGNKKIQNIRPVGAYSLPDFGQSVNPISIRGDSLCALNYNWHLRICEPSWKAGPDEIMAGKFIYLLLKY